MSRDAARPGRRLMRGLRAGVLATQSVRFEGFPYGSAVPCALDAHGRPVVLISQLAAHTQNLDADPRASLTVHQDDVVTAARLTLLGTFTKITPDDPGARRYLALFPDAAAYAGFGDFGFRRLDPVAGHYVGGFGDIRWFDGADFVLPAGPLDPREQDILDHMNADHADTLRDYCRHRFGAIARDVRMLTVDADGFDVLADGRIVRFEFEAEVTDADAARRELVRLAQAARAAPGATA